MKTRKVSPIAGLLLLFTGIGIVLLYGLFGYVQSGILQLTSEPSTIEVGVIEAHEYQAIYVTIYNPNEHSARVIGMGEY